VIVVSAKTNMKVIVLTLAIAVAVYALPVDDDGSNMTWEEFKNMYNKKYMSQEEELTRMEIFESNKQYVKVHNMNKDKHGFDLAINEFCDMGGAEFAKLYNGYLRHLRNTTRNNIRMISLNTPDLPDTVDWRTKGVVTPIKNQGQCGSCWAFSTTGSLEGQHALKTGTLVSLSEQQLVDCSGSYGNHGCEGGLMDYAFRYIEANKGDDTESSYPYVAHDERCHFKSADVGATCTGYKDVEHESESALQEAVANVGPISVAIDAGHSSFQMYRRGVYYEPSCSQTRLDHGVLAIGYGVYGTEDYWLVKNSWGTSWGMKGYIMMSRNRNNNCGIASQASYPTV
jgi:cathepsin L